MYIESMIVIGTPTYVHYTYVPFRDNNSYIAYLFSRRASELCSSQIST